MEKHKFQINWGTVTLSKRKEAKNTEEINAVYKRPDQQDLTVRNIKLSYQEKEKSCDNL